MLQSAHTTRTGWKKRRLNRSWSVSRPKALRCSIHWAMLPGKTATKNAATTTPTSTRRRRSVSKASPSAISTAPESRTTRSASSGTQSGTWAWNSSRANDRWLTPAYTSTTPRRTRKADRTLSYTP